jgi:hypothetical protein
MNYYGYTRLICVENFKYGIGGKLKEKKSRKWESVLADVDMHGSRTLGLYN